MKTLLQRVLLLVVLLLVGACGYGTDPQKDPVSPSVQKLPEEAVVSSPEELGSGYEQESSALSQYAIRDGVVYIDDAPLVGADPETFQVIRTGLPPGLTNHVYAKDKKGVFYQDQRLEGALPDSFVVLPAGYAKDRDKVFWVNSVTTLDPQSVRILLNPFREHQDEEIPEYAVDTAQVYCNGERLAGADPSSFEITSDVEARDRSQQFESCQPL